MQIKKPFLAFLTASFFLVGCSSLGANLQGDVKKLYEMGKNTGQQVMSLADTLTTVEQGSPDYQKIWEDAKRAGDTLEAGINSINELSFTEENAQLGENAIAIFESTNRIVEKVRELAADGRYFSTEELPESESELTNIDTILSGYQGRLEKSKEKLDNLITQILEQDSNN